MTTLSEAVKGTPQYKQYRRILKTVMESVDLAALEKEAKTLHQSRPSRHLTPKQISPRVLTEAHMRDIANRARLVEIRVSLAEHQAQLELCVRTVRGFLTIEFGDASPATNRDDRRAYFDRYFRNGIAFLDEVNRIIAMLDLFIKDLDQCGFSMRNLVTLLQMIYTPERSV